MVSEPGVTLTIRYTNHRGETSVRNVIPQRLWFGVNRWHPELQWLLDAHDVDKDSDRTFALASIGGMPANSVPSATALIFDKWWGNHRYKGSSLHDAVAELLAAKEGL